MGGESMNNKFEIKNLWIFAGSCFILASMINFMSNDSKWYIAIIQLITAAIMFFNAYIFRKKDRNE